MLTRYGKNKRGKSIKVATIYTSKEHKIDIKKIDKDALMIIRRLKHAGYDAYIVGGAVRDLILNKVPKDFDIATDATPRQIKKIFRNARIIGKRFRLVHIHFSNKIIEVSTFRGLLPGDEQNFFGTMEDDVKRRDFSFNALYYSPANQQLVDYVGGFEDIMNKKIVSLIPLDVTFKEDPVRLIRAVKYASITGFSISARMKKALKKYSNELKNVSISRITEELFKILSSGSSSQIFNYCIEFDMLRYIVPVIDKKMNNEVLESLDTLDKMIGEKAVKRGTMLYSLVRMFLPRPTNEMIADRSAFRESFRDIKKILSPLTPPNVEVESAVILFFKELEIPTKNHSTYNYKKATNTKNHRNRDAYYRKKRVK